MERSENKSWVLLNWEGSEGGCRAQSGALGNELGLLPLQLCFFPEVPLAFWDLLFETLFLKEESFLQLLLAWDHVAGSLIRSGF